MRFVMAQNPTDQCGPSCLIAATKGCSWSRYHKHEPLAGMTKLHTKGRNPARYLERSTIESIERATATSPDQASNDNPTGKTEYLRDVSVVIGWDGGLDAKWSFVECSGSVETRRFHGRPMNDATKKEKEKKAQGT